MRENKYRVWWVHPESDSRGFDYFNAIDGYSVQDSAQEIIGIDQFTGLHDKNGKEIYEGDIVKIIHITGGETNTAIFWHERQAGFCWTDDYGDRLNFCAEKYQEKRFEVIGNIHENPELIK